jgi:twitching motility protein PilT
MPSKVSLPALLKAMVDQGASDLHITSGVPPELRMSGKMVKVRSTRSPTSTPRSSATRC